MAPEICIDYRVKRRFQIKEKRDIVDSRNMCPCPKVLRKVSIWSMQPRPGKKLGWFTRMHLSPVPGNQQEILLLGRLDFILTKPITLWESTVFCESAQLSLKNGPCGSAALRMFKKLTSLMTSVSNAILATIFVSSIARLGERPAKAIEQLNCSSNCLAQHGSRRFWEWTREPPDSFISWLPNRSVKVVTIDD